MNISAFFHLNLAYSSLDEHHHLDVIDHAYEPILELAQSYPIGIEVNGWTLERIVEAKPSFIEQLKSLIHSGQVEILASGYVQLIMAFAPSWVNQANIVWGNQVFMDLLGTKGNIFHPPELVVPPELARLVAENGFERMIIEYENLMDSEGWPRHCPNHIENLSLIPCSTLMMQSTQKFVAGDLTEKQYLNNLAKQPRWTTVYSGDAEIFGFRPNRYQNEYRALLQEDWPRLRSLIALVAKERCWNSLARWPKKREHQVKNPHGQTLVKKQRKYNLSRWSVSGRNDVWLNTLSHQWSNTLKGVPPDSKRWLPVLKLWASDLRTHITERRWARVAAKIDRLRRDQLQPVPFGRAIEKTKGVALETEEHQLRIETATTKARLNMRRGLALESLRFSSQAEPCFQSYPQGHFRSMELFADFWSGTALMEGWREDQRWTDLSPANPKILESDTFIRVSIQMICPFGRYHKHISFFKKEAKVLYEFQFDGEGLHEGVLHVGNFTLAEPFEAQFWAGKDPERGWLGYQLKEMNPTHAVSGRVTSRPCISTPTGNILLGSEKMQVAFKWDPSKCAALSMLRHTCDPNGPMTRLLFSLGERDETRHPHPAPPHFQVAITPADNEKVKL